MFLLDTDAISELERPQPNPGFIDWLNTVDWLDVYLSVITVGELAQGIARLPQGPKRRALDAMFDLLPDRFHQRILAVDYATAVRYGQVQASIGPLPTLDTLIAATALTHRLTVVSHNAKDLGRTGATVLDPWTS